MRVKLLYKVLALSIVLTSSCSKPPAESSQDVIDISIIEEIKMRRDLVLKQCSEEIPLVRSILREYANADVSMAYFNNMKAQPILNIQYDLYGRYLVSVTMPIVLDESRSKLISNEQAEFYLYEVQTVKKLSDGRYHTKYGNTYKRFGESLWFELERSGFDYDSIGVELNESSPVLGFEYAR